MRAGPTIIAVAIVGAVALTVALWPRERYDGMSRQSYDIAMALYAACNAEDLQRVSEIEAIVASDAEGRAIEDREADWFHDVIDLAKQGQWRDAARQARMMLGDQVAPHEGDST